MQGLTNLRGKSFTLAASGIDYDLRTNVPALFTGIVQKDDRFEAVYLIEIKSNQNFSIRLTNNYDGVQTDLDTITSGNPRRFFIADVSVKDIVLRPSTNNQVFYAYVVGN
ncbi:MAG: hypothetical protein L6Q54_11610 [Leptospiraceae bacterium]|nr:hypothetical protein [Leptospiraceae bacterium]